MTVCVVTCIHGSAIDPVFVGVFSSMTAYDSWAAGQWLKMDNCVHCPGYTGPSAGIGKVRYYVVEARIDEPLGDHL